MRCQKPALNSTSMQVVVSFKLNQTSKKY